MTNCFQVISINRMELNKNYIETVVRNALAEDIGSGDITSKTIIPRNTIASGTIILKEDGVICGIEFAETAFRLLDKNIELTVLSSDGEYREAKTPIIQLRGSARNILSAERVALNFLCHLSGIATLTRKFVDAVRGTNAIILDTRKTTPGLRLAEKYAVRCGGGQNHRMGLFDMVLIKDNHIASVGGIKEALTKFYSTKRPDILVEVEVTSCEMLKIALQFPVDRILLDNFHPDEVSKAIAIRNRMKVKTPFECSGGITLEDIRDYANTGVEYISLGALTHSAPNLDMSLEIEFGRNK